MMRRRHLLALSASTWLTACATLPKAGPATSAIVDGGTAKNTPAGDQQYKFVNLTEQIAVALGQADTGTAASGFASLLRATPLGLIGVGDLLQITLWEPNPTGATLLSPPGLDVSLRVDPSGSIDLPYAGPLRAAGRTPMSLQRGIMAALTAQGHSNIQAAVLDAQSVSNSAIVEGDAARPGAYPLGPGTNSLLNLIAIAGGSKFVDFATTVRVTRDGASVETSLADIIADSDLDILMGPGDSIMLLPRDLSFYAFGAVNHPGVFSYDSENLTLAKALATIAGLQDNLAAPRGIFIYRRTAAAGSPQTIYRLDLSQPGSFFVADVFILHPDDIIYVSDAPVADLTKVLQTIAGVGNVSGIPRDFGAGY